MTTLDPNKTQAEDATTSGAESYCSLCGRSFEANTAKCPQDGTKLIQLAAEQDTLLGKVLDGRYEIKSPLGGGGMGTVYIGIQLSVDREVAIKVIHPKLASDRNAVKRFLREARLASRLNQPSIVNVYDFGQSEGVLFLVTELLRGHTLASELGNGRRLNIRRAAVIGIQLCDALEAAHAQDIVHRDLKPGNIVILDDPPGRDLVKVLDFGLAKSLAGEVDSAKGEHLTTNVGAVLGTPTYMAPEQIEGLPSDQRADLYALGIILYEMVSGAPPFVDPAVSAVLARHLGDLPAPLPSHVPLKFRNLVERLLAKSPADRVQSAGDARRVLQSTIEATPPSGIQIVQITDQNDTMPDIHGYAGLADTAAHTALRDPTPAPAAARASGRLGTEPTIATAAITRKSALVAVALQPTEAVASIAGPDASPDARPTFTPGSREATAEMEPAVRSRKPMLVIAGVFVAAVVAAGIVLAVAPGARQPAAGPRDAGVHHAPAVSADAAAAAVTPPPVPTPVTSDAGVAEPPPAPIDAAVAAIVLPPLPPPAVDAGVKRPQQPQVPVVPPPSPPHKPPPPHPPAGGDLDFYKSK